MERHIHTALLSVSNKEGLIEFAEHLVKHNVTLLSTGGTAKALRDAKLPVTDIAEHTGSPEIMDGRVKTLHPHIHGGILAIRDNKAHQQALKEQNITPIDLVVVNLYPFEDTVAQGKDAATCIENIDIGGPSMIRSAAKNHHDVTIATDPADYPSILADIEAHKGATTLALRQELAAKAFARTAAYDTAIQHWFATQHAQDSGEESTLPTTLTLSATRAAALRYGENPHQAAALYITDPKQPSVANATQLQGKALSYNNLSDAEAALELVNEFSSPAAAIIKHANPCGVACGDSLADALKKAHACDPVSAYGSIIALNQPIDEPTAEAISDIFVEVVIAPEAGERARAIFTRKKNLRVLLTGDLPENTRQDLQLKTITGGLLVQTRDYKIVTEKDLKVVTKRKPTKDEIAEMLFAFTVCKHVKSNAIVFTRDHTSVGIGAGQMSRVDSAQIASSKCGEKKTGSGLVVASDAFFPFADGVIAAHEAGATAIIQPGGSIRDDEVIEAANIRDMAMVFTNIRHFKH